MAVLVAEPIDRPASLFGDAADGDDTGGGPTLDDVLVGVWEGLAAHVAVTCPLCGGALRPAHHGGGRCADCGTTLD